MTDDGAEDRLERWRATTRARALKAAPERRERFAFNRGRLQRSPAQGGEDGSGRLQ